MFVLRRSLFRIVAGATLALTGTLLAAQPVPQPPQRPAGSAPPATAAPPSQAPIQLVPGQAPAPPGARAPTPTPGAQPARPQLADPDRPARAPRLVRGAQPARLTPEQTAAVQRVNEAFNAIRSMRGDFIQHEAGGGLASGQFFLTKPGLIRFQYAAPSVVDIVADGRNLAVRDRRLNTQDMYLIDQTPLRHFLRDRVDLLREARILSVQADAELVIIAIEERGAMTEGQLTLFFDAQDHSLKQWTTTDAQGQETAVRIRNVVVGQPNNPQLFAIDQFRPN